MADTADNDWLTRERSGGDSDPAARAHLGRFDALPRETPRGPLLAGIGEAAGVVDLGRGYAVAFGLGVCRAAADLDTVVDDLEALGARPIGMLDAVRSSRPAGVVAGLGERGRARGLARIGGVLDLATGDPTPADPLVSVLVLGVLRHDELRRADAEGAPDAVAERPFARPHWIDALNADTAERLPRDDAPAAHRALLLRLVASPALCDRSAATEQFDCYVHGNTVLAHPEPAGMVRIDADSGLGAAVALTMQTRLAGLNPYLGAQSALAEAYRKVAGTGAEPLAVADCLAVGSPEDPHAMWQFVEAILGLVDGCRELGLPVTGGDVSFGRESGHGPTTTVGVLGVIDDIATRTASGFAEPGDEIWLLGETREELSGSAWAEVRHGHLGGMPPRIDFAAEKALAALLTAAARVGVLSSARPLAVGGLAQALVESCLRRGFGAEVDLTGGDPTGGDPTVELYAESTARVLISLPGERVGELRSLAEKHEVPVRRLGSVTSDGDDAALEIEDLLTIPLAELRAARAGTLPAALV